MQVEASEWLTAKEFLELHKGMFSRNTFYEQVKRGAIPSIRLGKKIFVRRDAFDQMLKAQVNDGSE